MKSSCVHAAKTSWTRLTFRAGARPTLFTAASTRHLASASARPCSKEANHGTIHKAADDVAAATTVKKRSLRRVTAEAQGARHGFIKGRGKRRFIDPEADTHRVTASCAAEQYNMPLARQLLQKEGYHIDPLNTGLYPQVIHIQTLDQAQDRSHGPGDIFVFPAGTIVAWNAPEQLQRSMVDCVLLPAAENAHLDKLELEDLEYLEDTSRSTSELIGDTIVLGTKTEERNADTTTALSPSSSADLPDETDAVLAKIAFSSGLARSTKLAVLENLLSSYFHSTRSIPLILSRGSALRFTRSFILRKTGELLSIRAQLNLYSELTDSLPDLFWDSPSALRLSDYYDEVGRALDVNVRIRVLNEKMDHASEIAGVMRERLSEKHSTGLEWLIIFLISVEVGFELMKIWRERRSGGEGEGDGGERTEVLLRRWLEREEARALAMDKS